MPVKNVIKDYFPETYYHLYNLGIDSRTIFEDEEDYQTFLGYLAEALTPPPDKKDTRQTITINGNTFKGSPRRPKNLFGTFELHAFCLMPNHFHLLIKQKQKKGIETFMRSLGTRYVMYFNKRHSRRGPLFQGTYKAIQLDTEAMILHLSRFIHQKTETTSKGLFSHHSSYPAYIGKTSMPWVTTSELPQMLERDALLHSLNPNYAHFIEKFNEDSIKVLGDLTLEEHRA